MGNSLNPLSARRAPAIAAGIDEYIIEDPGETGLERAMPWLSSLMMHAGLALVGGFVLFAAMQQPRTEKFAQPVFVASAGEMDNVDLVAKPTLDPALAQATSLQAMQNLLRNVPDPGFDAHGDLDSLRKSMAGQGDKPLTEVLAIYRGTDASLGPGKGISRGDGPGRAAPWGPSLIEGGPQGTILPKRILARRVVYLLDHSGSMLDSFDYLREEVKTAIQHLKPYQSFSVIMFSEDVSVLGPDRLERALPDFQRTVDGRLAEIQARGQNDGLLEPFQKGFQKAFAMKPELIIFLTDGEFDPKLVDVVKRLNKDKVQIHTIAYIQITPEAADGLKKIAADNGGTYKFVSANDLHK